MVLDYEVKNRPSVGLSLLHTAAHLGQMDVLDELIVKEADKINALDHKGATALHYATQNFQESACLSILDAGADSPLACRIWGTALHCASYNGLQRVVQAMLEQKINVNVTKRLGFNSSCGRNQDE